MIRMSLNKAYALAESVLKRQGFSDKQTQALAQVVVAGQRDECHSHGLYRLLNCVCTLQSGKVDASAEPVLHDQTTSLIRVDAQGGFSQLAFQAGLPLLEAKAKQHGLAALIINHCVHFSALWVEIEALTERGLVGIACNPSHAWVAPEGGTQPLFGTNPIAFGWPRPMSQYPFIFDFATSAVARGDLQLHRREGKPIPLGWGIDAQGQPTQEAAAALKGAMLTFGGHKGSALAAMIELIAGPLIGDLTSAQSLAYDGGCGASPYHGELIIAMDPSHFMGTTSEQSINSAEMLFTSMIDQGARLPSQRRYEARERSLKHGIAISKSLYDDLVALA
ncbi:Ldh family oxidoreductase [Halomonas sp. WWR20]